MESKLIDLIDRIAEKAERRLTFLSEFPEWIEDEDIKDEIVATAQKWSGMMDDNGNIYLGRLWHKLLLYKHYSDYVDGDKPVPFHCYAISDIDVVFTTDTLEWSDDEQKYVGIKADIYRDMSKNILKNQGKKEETKAPAEAPSSSSSSGCMVIILAIIIAAFSLMF